MKRVDYLSTLGVVTVLLVAEVKDTQTDFKITKPVYFCVMMRLLFNISYYSFFASIIISLVSALTALHTGTAAQVLSPSLLTFFGLAIYCLLRGMHDYALWSDFYVSDDYHNNDDDESTSKENTMHALYLVSIIPLLVCVILLIPGSIYIVYKHIRDRLNYKKMGLVFDERDSLEFAKPLKAGQVPNEIDFRVYEAMLKTFEEALLDGSSNPYDAARRRAQELITRDPDRVYLHSSKEAMEGLMGSEKVASHRPAISFAMTMASRD